MCAAQLKKVKIWCTEITERLFWMRNFRGQYGGSRSTQIPDLWKEMVKMMRYMSPPDPAIPHINKHTLSPSSPCEPT